MSDTKTFGEKLLKRQGFGTRVEGNLVVMTLGNKEVTLDHVTALRLAAFLRHSAREARVRSGGPSVVTVYADLTDANLDELEAQRSRDGGALFAKVGGYR